MRLPVIRSRSGDMLLGPVLLALVVAAVIGWIALSLWLQDKARWPESFGFRYHGARGQWIEDLLYSPALLRRGGPYDYALFVDLWSYVILPISFAVHLRLRKRQRSRDLIAPPSNAHAE